MRFDFLRNDDCYSSHHTHAGHVAPLADLFVVEAINGLVAPVSTGAESVKWSEVEHELVNRL